MIGRILGQNDPHRPIDAATASGRFTALDIELYELVLFSPLGATVGALMSKERLMDLQLPSTMKEPDAPPEKVAVAVREAIREASDRIANDVRTSAVDRTAAARTLLGLQGGLETLRLKDRRAAAAGKLKTSTRTLTKTRYVSEARKKYEPSPELELVADLGQHLLSMEADFLRTQSRAIRAVDRESEPPDHEYPRLYKAWYALDSLNVWLLANYAAYIQPGGELDSEAADYFLLAWVEVMLSFDRPARRPSSSPIEDIEGADAANLIAAMFRHSPNDAYRAWFYTMVAAQGTHTLGDAEADDPTSWLGLTSQWLASCKCEFTEERYGSCPVHQFSTAASELKRQVERQWVRIAPAATSPSDYGAFVSERPRDILGLQIDK